MSEVFDKVWWGHSSQTVVCNNSLILYSFRRFQWMLPSPLACSLCIWENIDRCK